MNTQTDRLDEHIAVPKRPPASEVFVPDDSGILVWPTNGS
jgi:hypothetical protein